LVTVVGGVLTLLLLTGAGGFAAGWLLHPVAQAQQSTDGRTAPYLPVHPGTGDDSRSGAATGSGPGSGSGSGTTGVTRSQVAAVAAKADRALVDINAVLGYQNGEAAGTGIVIGSHGVVLTNNHVVAGATSITATDIGNHTSYRAAVVGYDRSADIAVLRLAGASGLATATRADGASVRAGEPVVAIGNAGGTGIPIAVGGVVSALNQSITAQDESSESSEQLSGLIQVSADIQPGDSGGPLLTTSGQVIGVDTAASADFQYRAAGGEGFAIPIGTATRIANEIRAGLSSNKVHIGATAYLGIEAATGSRGFPGAVGPVILGVVPGSPADSAGLTRGDEIRSLPGITISSATALTHALDRYHPGDRIKLGWTDLSGRSHTSSIKLTTGPVG
jgi:S1-C subfamily serine protease